MYLTFRSIAVRVIMPLVVLSVCLGPCTLHAEEQGQFYTVQAGTYTPAALFFAKKHYKTLKETLKESDLAFLRIEQGTKYYIVRIGKFDTYDKAVPLLETVKELVPDAFIVEQENFESIKIVELYKAGNTSPQQTTNSDTIPAEYYTLQTGNFLKLDQASEEFKTLGEKLKEDTRDTLRVEKVDKYFSVRVGRFETYTSARTFLRNNEDILPGSSIVKSSTEEENVILAYGDPTRHAVITTEQTRPSIPPDESQVEPQDTLAEKKRKELESLFNDISAEYYGEQYGRAAELLRRGIEKYPDNADLHAWYGATLLNMRFADKALEEYQRAADISPDVPEFHAGMGHSLLNIYMDRARDSISSFQKALEIDPDNVSALEGLGFVYASIGKRNEAISLQQHLQELDPDAAVRLGQAIVNGVDWSEE